MNKEEILSKSRSEKKDEGMELAETKGRKAGITAFCIVFVILVFINLFSGRSNNAIFSMFWAYSAAEAFPKYKFTGKKSYRVTVIAGSLASFAFLLAHIIDVMGW